MIIKISINCVVLVSGISVKSIYNRISYTCDLAVLFQTQSIFCINLLNFAKFQTDFDCCTPFKNKIYKIRHIVKLVTM